MSVSDAPSPAEPQKTTWAAWERWAEGALNVPADRRALAVEAAAQTLGAGLSPHAAVIAARISAGVAVPPYEVRALQDELNATDRVAMELATLQAAGNLTEAGLAQTNARYQAKLTALRSLLNSVTTYPAPQPTVAQPLPAPPGPSLREFFADNSILLISIAGAFLLIVATLLFEIYGTSGFGGEARFGGVLALNVIFGAAGYLSIRRPSLRLVGQTYLAIFALMVPLTVAAAWVFLSLDSKGITRDFAFGIGGLSCAALYAVLAARLGSRAYAGLSMVALAVGWAGLVAAAHAGIWTGPWLTALVFTYVAVAFPPARSPRPLALFTKLAEPFLHGAAVVAIVWSLGQAISEWTGEFSESQPHISLQLSTTFGLLTVAYGLYAWRSRRSWMLWTVWAGASLTVLAAIDPLALGQRGYVVGFAILAWTYAVGTRWMPGRGLRGFLHVGAAVQAAFPALFNVSPDGLQAIVLLATAGVGVFFALDNRRPAWLLLAVGIFSVDWYWLARSLLPPPAHPTADLLVLTYSPLPALYGLVGLGLRLAGYRRWTWPVYAGGAVAAVGVAISAASQNDLTLAGRALIVYAGLAYVAAALDRWWPGLLGALLASEVAVLLLLAAASPAPYWYPLAMTGVAILVYAAHAVWGNSLLGRVHRYSGLATVALTAASSFAVPDFWQRSSPGSVAGLVALLATAGLTLVDARLYRRPLLDYVAAVIASLGSFWVVRYLGVDNIQAYVALPGLVLIAAGLVAPQDARRPADLAICRVSIVAGAVVLMGASAIQSATESTPATYTTLWVIEAVLLLLVGIGARSRTLVVAAGAGLVFGALRALLLILESVQIYVVFGVIAILLLITAAVLAALRERMATARSVITRSWDEWT